MYIYAVHTLHIRQSRTPAHSEESEHLAISRYTSRVRQPRTFDCSLARTPPPPPPHIHTPILSIKPFHVETDT